jgi:hypothetical protein
MCTVHNRTTRNPGPGLARTWTWTRTCPEIWALFYMWLCGHQYYYGTTYVSRVAKIYGTHNVLFVSSVIYSVKLTVLFGQCIKNRQGHLIQADRNRQGHVLMIPIMHYDIDSAPRAKDLIQAKRNRQGQGHVLMIPFKQKRIDWATCKHKGMDRDTCYWSHSIIKE